jgi:hypothetical protein
MTVTRIHADVRDAIVLAYSEDWVFRDNRILSTVPASWVKPPTGLTVKVMGETCKVLALYCCPHCKTVGLLTERVHVISNVGKVEPDLRCNTCHLHRPIFLDKWNVKPLYACAVERLDRGHVKREIHYMHATNAVEARFHLGQGNYKIVAIGPAVGYLAKDEHGEVLAADAMSPGAA